MITRMDWTYFGFLVAIGVSGGVMGSMLGVGGGILVIPLLTLGLGAPMKEAIACSLIAVAATACASAATYTKRGLTNVRLGLLLETTTAAGAVAGALIATAIDARVLAGLFAIVLAYAGYSMFRSRRHEDHPLHHDPGPNGAATFSGSLSASFRDPAREGSTEYDVRRLPMGLGVGGFAGLLSGLLGIGGGVVQVPLMNLAMAVPIKAAVATSSFMIGITAIGSSFVYYQKGYLDPLTAGPLFVGVLLGTQVGVRAVSVLRAQYLKLVFSAILFAVAALMALRAVGNRI